MSSRDDLIDETSLRLAELEKALRERDLRITDLQTLLQERDEQIARLEKLLEDRDSQIANQRETLHAILNSKGWRLLESYRRLKRSLRRPLAAKTSPRPLPYERWLAETRRLMPAPELFVEQAERFPYRPLISVVMPVYETSELSLRRALDSVLDQYYPNWELCICDDDSREAHVSRVLREYTDKDARIHVVFSEGNRGIAAASNRAIGLARGEFIALFDHDDELPPEALFEVVRLLQEDPEADVIYSDEDKLDEAGRHTWPFFKPDWSPDLLLSHMYTCHLGVYRKTLVDELGGFREGFDGCQDYDLVLRLTERTERVRHVPRVLYHWRMGARSASGDAAAKPETQEKGRRVLEEALVRRGIEAKVLDGCAPNIFAVRRKLTGRPLASIIIPTKDRANLLARCLSSIEARTGYPSYEILIVDHESKEPRTRRLLQECGHRVIPYQGPFNFARINNLAAKAAGGTHLLFLNNDTEVHSRDWLEAMLEHGQRPEVGAVGAKLLYPDGRIQHAGVVLGVGGVANHSHRFLEGPGYFGFADTIRNYSAVTAACMLVRREVFEEVGGFDEALAVNFNDVDFCLRLRQAGYLVVYTPYAVLTHHESATREPRVEPPESDLMYQRWGSTLENDPYYNENLTRVAEDFSLGPPRPYNARVDVYQYVSGTTFGELTAGRSVGQSFPGRRNHLTAVSVRFGTYARRSSGRLRFVLREDGPEGRELVRSELAAADIVDNEAKLFWFSPLPDSRGKQYHFEIECLEGRLGSSVTLWGNALSVAAVGGFFRDGKPAEGCLAFATYALYGWSGPGR